MAVRTAPASIQTRSAGVSASTRAPARSARGTKVSRADCLAPVGQPKLQSLRRPSTQSRAFRLPCG